MGNNKVASNIRYSDHADVIFDLEYSYTHVRFSHYITLLKKKLLYTLPVSICAIFGVNENAGK